MENIQGVGVCTIPVPAQCQPLSGKCHSLITGTPYGLLLFRVTVLLCDLNVAIAREPAPLNYFRRIQLGDVGYVRKGCFHLLFHAGKSLGDSEQLGVDVPLTFQLLTVGPVINTQPRLPGCLSTTTVRESGVGVEASVCAVPCVIAVTLTPQAVH